MKPRANFYFDITIVAATTIFLFSIYLSNPLERPLEPPIILGIGAIFSTYFLLFADKRHQAYKEDKKLRSDIDYFFDQLKMFILKSIKQEHMEQNFYFLLAKDYSPTLGRYFGMRVDGPIPLPPRPPIILTGPALTQEEYKMYLLSGVVEITGYHSGTVTINNSNYDQIISLLKQNAKAFGVSL